MNPFFKLGDPKVCLGHTARQTVHLVCPGAVLKKIISSVHFYQQ